MMKKRMQKLSPGLRMILLLFAAITVWQCVVHWFPARANTQGRDEKSIVREIAYAYYWEQDPSAKRVERLLSELGDVNPEAAEKWQEILDCWTESNREMPVHYGSLPAGLEDGSQLCLIVLGFQLNPDGSMQKELVSRLETALKSAEKYPESFVLCTGGGTAQSSDVTEAEVMAQWLEEHGIDEERIITENNSLTTSQNAIFSCQLLSQDYPEITQAALISSDYHLPWASILFQTQFILGEYPITLVSNAACRTNESLSDNALLRLQMNGILEIAGIN